MKEAAGRAKTAGNQEGALLRGYRLGQLPAHILLIKEDLPLKVVVLDEVAIDKPNPPDAGSVRAVAATVPSAPQPTMTTLLFWSLSWPVLPISGKIICLEYLSEPLAEKLPPASLPPAARGRMVTSSPSRTLVSRPSPRRMSWLLTKTVTNRFSSLVPERPSRIPGKVEVKFSITSLTVVPVTSTCF